MRLACGLDSLALGETQILGQLKQAYQHSRQQGAMGRVLSQTFEASFSVAKKIRTQTEISKYPTSISYLSVLMAKRIFSDLSTARVLLLGAGENIKDLIPHLKAHNIKDITITNRTYDNARKLATSFNMKARPFAELKLCVADADIIITSTYSDERLIDFNLVKEALRGQKHRPILMLDLGVPRDIHENVKQHQDVYLYSIDDLTAIADENKTSRKKAAEEAEKLIAYESCAFTAKLYANNHNHIIVSMREKAELTKQKAINQAKKQLQNGEAPEQVIENLAYTLTNQLLHEPTVKMRQALMSQDKAMVDIFKQNFGKK
jgi:glutamyl-tRNA reductase